MIFFFFFLMTYIGFNRFEDGILMCAIVNKLLGGKGIAREVGV